MRRMMNCSIFCVLKKACFKMLVRVYFKMTILVMAGLIIHVSTALFQGTANADTFVGTDGPDTITGTNGDDVLEGLGGNDNLYGGSGNDIYVFSRGFGVDCIYDFAGTDVIKFSDEILPSDVFFSRSRENLIIEIADTQDKLTVTGYFNKISHIEEIRFAALTPDYLKTVFMAKPTDGDDDMRGYDDEDDILEGLAGNDKIYGFGGNDTLTGGVGDDGLYGGPGNDILNGGDGEDKLDGDSGNDTLDGGNGNDRLKGGDGDDILNGGDGNDKLFGDNDSLYGQETGNDILNGGAGNDSLQGGSGNDIYRFSPGFGVDELLDLGGTDAIEFTSGILPSNIRLSRNNDDLIIETAGSTDKIAVYAYFSFAPIEQIRFADNTVWTPNDVDGLLGK